jgi:TonB-linked SusC/RagA family outer membrane protein
MKQINTKLMNRWKPLMGALSIRKIASLFTLILLLGINASFAQQRTISGTVTDGTTGETLPGASVKVKGTSRGATTDLDGNFKVEATANDVLVVSFIGYATQEIEIGNKTSFDIQMGLDVSQLSEVVVVGYGTQEEKDVTGVVSTVNEKEFNQGQIASPERLITGKIAGVNVNPGNTRSGGASITIRGRGSLQAQREPLVVVDGVPIDTDGSSGTRNANNFINPSDIESVTVLKDASATAIYGSRAAAGVIMYTTKSGKAGKTQVAYDGSVVYSQIFREPEFLNPANFRAVVANKAPQRSDDLGEASTDWFNAVTQPTFSQNHNVSFSGGNETINFRGSINRLNNREVIVGDENTVTRLSLLLSAKFWNDNLKVTFNTKNALNQDTYKPNVAGLAASFDPSQPIYVEGNDEFGGYYEWEDQGLAPTNPVSQLEQQVNKGENRRSFNSLNFDLKIPYVDGLSLNSSTTFDTKDGSNNYFEPFTLRNTNRDGFISNSVNKAYTFTHFSYANYKKTFGSSDIDFMLGYEFNEQYRETYGYFGENLRDDITAYFQPSQIPQDEIQINALSPVRNRLQSYFGRINYSLQDKYIATFTYRADGSTKFGPGNRYAFFPSAALGWRIIEEDFFQDLTDAFTNLKLRVGYGVTGNQFIPDYLYEKNYFVGTQTASYQFGDNYYQVIRPTAVDPNIQWERLVSTNIGIDFGILNGRMSGTIDVYTKDTDQLLFNAPVAAGTNVGDRVVTNIGSMNNSGIEVAVNNVVYDNTDFTWNLNYNFTYNRNRITALNNEQDENSFGIEIGGIAGDVGQNIQIIRVGEAYGSFLAFNQLYDDNGLPVKGPQPVTYEDVNGDGSVNENDLVVQGVADSPILVGITSNMTYKNFDLSFTLRGKFGGTVYNNTASANGYYNRLTEGNILNNVHESALTSDFNIRHLKSNYYLENSDFVKLDNLTIGYNFNQLNNMNLRAYTTVQNMIPITGYSGLDPEAGIDNNIFPPSTAFIFGISAKF